MMTSIIARTVDQTRKAGESSSFPISVFTHATQPHETGRIYPGKDNGPYGYGKLHGRLAAEVVHKRAPDAHHGKRPPKRPLPPERQTDQHARVAERPHGVVGQEHPLRLSRLGGPQLAIQRQQRGAERLQTEACLPPRPARDHLGKDLRADERLGARLGLPRRQDAGDEEDVEGYGQGQPEADLEVRDDDHRHLFGRCEEGPGRGGGAERAGARRRSEGRNERQLGARREAIDEAALRMDRVHKDERDKQARRDSQPTVHPPQHVNNHGPGPPAPRPGYDHQGQHLHNRHEGDADAREARRLGGVGRDGPEGRPGRGARGGEAAQVQGAGGGEERNGRDPEDDGDGVEPAEAVVELVQHEGDAAGALRDEEPRRVEAAQGEARVRGPAGDAAGVTAFRGAHIKAVEMSREGEDWASPGETMVEGICTCKLKR
ncbi:hypothetical protein VFPFJ_09642 [Purpureocillium lilacinum]|uniref:Uncharacterized protein n=1 Tax=Purpureocillium lilacinum TaxID=33203 RepID=A0A179GTB8_PURLI|nr:hypothetical protein VFPFJ_09642 [Purpureocillium lilacinum]OAQ81187.1 hypothetical protein VFPFJ_09642 [Purpureocillium lilacinum]